MSIPFSHALYSVAEIRAIEQAALACLPPGTLMQRAGQAAAKVVLELLPHPRSDTKVLILAGPGNNGGDALETAAQLAQAGLHVTVLFTDLFTNLRTDGSRQSADAQQALQHAKNASVHFIGPDYLTEIKSGHWALLIDGLFGIGLTRAIAGDLRTLIEHLNTLHCPVLALDLPSGLNADTGNIVGDSANGIAVCANHTISFIGNKPGLHTGYGRDYAGQVQIASLQIEEKHFTPARARLNDPALFLSALKRRPHASHKGSYGDIAIFGGAHGMCGAPILSARAAAHCGAGRVFAVFLDQAPLYDSAQPELMCRLAAEFDFAGKTLVVGPGLGTSRKAHDVLAQSLATHSALLLDADALNLIALESGLRHKLQQRQSASLITPHPLEAARLLGISAAQVQADRPTAARMLAQQLNVTVILKGSGSIIALADGDIVINPTGNPALASAGTGDVLAGVCGALLAQGWPVHEAALGAVWLHGRAADLLVAAGTGPIGMTAGELMEPMRKILNELSG